MTKPTNPALQSGNALAAGLVRCYPFHEGVGSTLHDLAPGHRDATTRIAGSPAVLPWSVDPDGGPFVTFNGTNQEATAPDDGMPAGSSPRTIAWRCRASVKSEGNGGYLFGYGTGGDNALGTGLAAYNDGDTLQRARVTTIYHGSGGTADLTDGQWHLCVATIDESVRLRIYVDGVQVLVSENGNSTPTLNPIPFSPLDTVLSGTMYLGRIGGTNNNGGPLPLFFRGDIDGEWVWDRALSPSDVTSLQADPWQMVRPVVTGPTITVDPPSANLPDGTQSVLLTPTLLNGSGPIGVAKAGGGTLSATSVASGSPVRFVKPNGDTASTVLTFSAAGAVSVTVTVGYTSDSMLPVLQIDPDEATCTVGESVTITASLFNATGSLAAVILDLPTLVTGTLSTSTPTSGGAFTCTPAAAGSCIVRVSCAAAGLFGSCVITANAPEPVEPILFEVELETYLKAKLDVPVWAGFIPQKKGPTKDTPAALVYNLITSDGEEDLAGPSDVVAYTFQFDAYGNTRLEAITLMARLNGVLQGYAGMMGKAEVLNVLRSTQNHASEMLPDGSGGATQRRMAEYVIWFREIPPVY